MDLALRLLALIATVIGVTAVAERLRFPPPLLLMLVGIVASFVPFVPAPTLTPDLVLVGFLPPLLYAAAIRTSVIDFRTNWRAISYLSVLLVLVTAAGVGLLTWLLLPVPFAAAFALGAVVAPPDAVAATTIARRVGLPRRLVTVLEGESLVNDATAITCLRVALAALAGSITAGEVVVGFLLAAVGGALVGLGVAALVLLLRKHTNRPVYDTAISLLVPFAAYLPAEKLGYGDFHGSGVIAVVTAGLVLGHTSPSVQSGRSRISERLNWATIQFLLDNTVFFLIGLQAERIVAGIASSALGLDRIVVFCAAVLATVIILRLVWIGIARYFLFYRDPRFAAALPPWTHSLVLGWAGLRGVVTLAAAFLLPPIEHREVLLLAAMVVVAGTLLLQGLTLPALIRRLNVRSPDPRSDALQAATLLETASTAALAELERVRQPSDSDAAVRLVRERIRSRSDAFWERLGIGQDLETPAEEYRRLRLGTLGAERREVLAARSTGRIDHEVIEEVLASLDVEESMLTIATERADQLTAEPVATPEHPAGACEDLLAAPRVAPGPDHTCQDCLREGTRPVHLRVCVSCGNVGCCDSSAGRHATRHFRASSHPVMQSVEPGEDWRWCYRHDRVG